MPYCGLRFGTSASEKVVCQTYHPPNHADYHQELKDNILQFKFPDAGSAGMPGRWRGPGGFSAGQARIARIRGRVDVQRLGAASMPGRWRGRGGFYAGQVARQECEHK